MTLALMQNLPRGRVATGEPLILASGSPRRAELMRAAGYEFTIHPASDDAECDIREPETVEAKVGRLAKCKAMDVVEQMVSSYGAKTGMVIGSDTLASCAGQILGKPRDRAHAEQMLRLLSGRDHDVLTGVCLHSLSTGRTIVDVSRTQLRMATLRESELSEHLDSGRWQGKAGAFGFQDGNDWLQIADGSESNVVGLPMERLAELLEQFLQNAEIGTIGPPSADKTSRENSQG